MRTAERVCVYPGSFDPITLGHVDVIRRGRMLFDRVIVAILRNEKKAGLFPFEERRRLADLALEGMDGVSVVVFEGLLKDLMLEKNARIVLRGLRAADEYEAEARMAHLNGMLLPGLETVFLPASPECAFISSSAAREIASFGGDASQLLPEASWEALQRRMSTK